MAKAIALATRRDDRDPVGGPKPPASA